MVFSVVHRLVGSAFLSNGYMGGLASRRAGGSRSIQQSFSMICRCENMTTNGLQGGRRGCAESDEGARSKFRAGQMVEAEMDRDEVPVNCEQAHKGIWGQAKEDRGGLEASDSKKKGEILVLSLVLKSALLRPLPKPRPPGPIPVLKLVLKSALQRPPAKP